MRTAWSARLTADANSDWNRASNAKTNTRVLTTGRTAVASPTAVIAATWSSVLSGGIASADIRMRMPVHERDPAQRTDPAQRRGSASAGMGVMNEPVAPVTTSSSTPAWRKMGAIIVRISHTTTRLPTRRVLARCAAARCRAPSSQHAKTVPLLDEPAAPHCPWQACRGVFGALVHRRLSRCAWLGPP